MCNGAIGPIWEVTGHENGASGGATSVSIVPVVFGDGASSYSLIHTGPIWSTENNGHCTAYSLSMSDEYGARCTDHEDTDRKSKEYYTYAVAPRSFYNFRGCARECRETEKVTEAHWVNDRAATLDETRLDSMPGDYWYTFI